MLHDDGVDERDGGRIVRLEPMPDERLGLVSENATGLCGVAGKEMDSEEVEVVLEPRPVLPPVPVPSPLELDPALSRKSARVGVTPSIPSSSGIWTRMSSLGLLERDLWREVRDLVLLLLSGRLLENGPSRMTRP